MILFLVREFFVGVVYNLSLQVFITFMYVLDIVVGNLYPTPIAIQSERIGHMDFSSRYS